MKTVKVFVAHSRADSDEMLEAVKVKVDETLRNAARTHGSDAQIVCVLGRDDHVENFKRAGSWDAWALDVIDRIDYVTRNPVYDVIVVTNRFVGKATSQIVSNAFARRRPIMLFCDDSVLRPIREIRCIEVGNMQNGWEVIAS